MIRIFRAIISSLTTRIARSLAKEPMRAGHCPICREDYQGGGACQSCEEKFTLL